MRQRRRLSEAQLKKLHHPYSRLVLRSLGEGGSEKTSSGFILLRRDKRAAQADLFTSDQRERLHPPSHKATVDKQARLLEFGEDVPASLHYAVARKKTFGFE